MIDFTKVAFAFHLNVILLKRQLLSASLSLFNPASFCSSVCCRTNTLSSSSSFRMATELSPDICLFKPLMSDLLLYPTYVLHNSFPFLVIVELALETTMLWMLSPNCCSRSSRAVPSFCSSLLDFSKSSIFELRRLKAAFFSQTSTIIHTKAFLLTTI